MIKSALSVLLLGMSVSIAVGQERTTDSSGLQFGELFPAQWMMHREIVDETGVNVGIVDDVILDVDNGRVAFLIIKRSKPPADHSDVKDVAIEQFLVVPSVLDESRSDQPLKLSILLKRVQESSTTMGRKPLTSFGQAELAEIYKHYEAELYWKSPKGVEALPSLMSADDLDGKLIRDADRIKLGRIEEVLLSPEKHWSIAFLALSQFKDHKSGDDRVAVPLSAFARRSTATTWLLDVPKEAKLLGTTFIAGNWPHEIDGGWIEFTHVKYGASAEGGIQNLDGQNAHSAN